eukprot:CAMPEP_0177627914 /NCGR_PEP_ID=MMETSP0419_2-20121207/31465_1 /TAXON_ID=582737 /ORGANISM="Tetraselmis sp., Strain GSL018" /LENGTH=762 /DNA_ID=CAMNT_0019129115 /DNA_START=134 /DNA_END=2421 /DNA_ORIENTATION=-
MEWFTESDEDEMETQDAEDEGKGVVSRLKSGQDTLKFDSNQRVFCPLCSNRDPKNDLYVLWQHCEGVRKSGEVKKLPKEHGELARHVAEDILNLPQDAPAREVSAASNKYNNSLPSKRRADEFQPEFDCVVKTSKVFVPEVDSHADDPLQIMWPPSVLVWSASQARSTCITRSEKVVEWIKARGGGEISRSAVVTLGFGPKGPSGSALVSFPDSLEGFLQAVWLWEPRGGEDSAAVGLQEQVQAREVLEEGPQPAQEPEVDAAQGAGGERHLGGKAGAALEHRQGDHEAAGDPRQVLGREVLQDVRPDIEAARGDAEDEEQLEEEFKKKEEEQSQMIAKLKEEHEKHAMALSRQTEEMAKRFEELKIEQSEQQMEFLQQHEENLKKLEERYLKEKMSLIQQKDAELAKLAEQESRWKHKATAEELRAREKELGQNKLRRKLKEEQDSKVERVLSMVRKHMEEDFKRREADLRNEVQETKEDSEYYSSLVNQMAAESRAAKDEVNDMKHHVIESWRNCCDVHWAFGEDLKPGSVVVKEVGELSNDEGFCKALEKHVLKKFGLPPGVRLRGELPEGLGNLESKFLDAQIHFAKEQSRLQKSYVEDGNFEPWTVSEKGYELNDNGMEELIKKCGREVADELRRVTLEIQKFNSSGRYPVFKLWNKAEGREATPTEVVEAMHARGEEMQERIEELEEVLREKTRPKKGNAMGRAAREAEAEVEVEDERAQHGNLLSRGLASPRLVSLFPAPFRSLGERGEMGTTAA